MKKIFLIALLFSLVLGVKAQEKWSLKKCVDYANEHNISLQLKKLDAEFQKNNVKQAKYSLLPNLNASSSYNLSYGRAASPETNAYIDMNSKSANFGVNSNVSLFGGFQKMNTIKQANIDFKAYLEDIAKTSNDISLRIVSYYLDILFKKELLQVAKEQLKVTQLQIERTSVLVEAGTLPKGTLMEQKAQAAQEELTVVTSENNLDLSLLDLAQLLDLNETETFDVEIPDLPVLNSGRSLLNPETVYDFALTSLPEIKAANLRLESTEKDLALARSGLMPSLTLNGAWGTSYSKVDGFAASSFSDQIKERENKYVGLSLNIPIFNRGLNRRNISNAKVNIDRSRLNLENTKNVLRKEIQQAHANAIAAMKKYFSSQTAVSSTEEAFRYTEEKFNLGLVNSVDYNEAKNNLLRSKSNLLQAKYEYIFRTKIIDFYNGVEISL
ncbi:TolC family protein [Ancylomarina salipaludis]|uniref:TolC family protein n=1 Tax=Ancylomarina salipaludis TaxID=2501299 RepID=A0A4V1MZU0_9BACT|nr:TolC family protein [Ancylomarina salipaludis]RXQ89061.1 TolC family protein [Ancylomarina salipaludis]